MKLGIIKTFDPLFGMMVPLYTYLPSCYYYCYRRLGSEGIRGLSRGSREPVRCIGIEDKTGDDGCPGGVEGPGGVEDPGSASDERANCSTVFPIFFTSSAYDICAYSIVCIAFV